MKLLLDENISPLFIDTIKNNFPGSVDIYDIDFAGRSDEEIYEYLKQNAYVLMTFDLDFTDIRKFPPEDVEGLIVLRFRNKKIQHLLIETLSYLEELKSLDFKHSLVIFQNSGIRIKKRIE